MSYIFSYGEDYELHIMRIMSVNTLAMIIHVNANALLDIRYLTDIRLKKN